MKEFINDDFLLTCEVAKHLYHEYAEKLPVIDYHCHLNPKDIAENHKFRSITEIWLDGDHYKWRALRANGVDEKYITDRSTSDWERFEKWAITVPYTMRNPLYHWTHLELKTAFGINETLNGESAHRIFERCNEMLGLPEFSACNLMRKYKVETVCTTDDPIDDLRYHKQIAKSDLEIKVLPTWRPDKVMSITDSKEYISYVHKLSEASDIDICSLATLLDALRKRQEYFKINGCCLADHGISIFPSSYSTMEEAERIFASVMAGIEVSFEDKMKFQSLMLNVLTEMNSERDWVQQIHYGPLRNVNSGKYSSLGADTGFDTIGDNGSASSISLLLDRLNSAGKLAKTILYNINPSDNYMIAAMIANYQDGIIPGKMQYGTAWWFNDNINGMISQINALSEQGLLSRFVGMLTDSRSFLSYTRHEYFRRILCNLIGNEVEQGLLPESEMDRISAMIEDICYFNAKRYFCF